MSLATYTKSNIRFFFPGGISRIEEGIAALSGNNEDKWPWERIVPFKLISITV
jgi:hypothetical protein